MFLKNNELNLKIYKELKKIKYPILILNRERYGGEIEPDATLVSYVEWNNSYNSLLFIQNGIYSGSYHTVGNYVKSYEIISFQEILDKELLSYKDLFTLYRQLDDSKQDNTLWIKRKLQLEEYFFKKSKKELLQLAVRNTSW